MPTMPGAKPQRAPAGSADSDAAADAGAGAVPSARSAGQAELQNEPDGRGRRLQVRPVRAEMRSPAGTRTCGNMRRRNREENTMDNTKIDWADMSWNPVTGCRHGCPYCYARQIATRYGGWTKGGKKTLANFFCAIRRNWRGRCWWFRRTERQSTPPTRSGLRRRSTDTAWGSRPESSSRGTSFVGSMADLFGAWVPPAGSWRCWTHAWRRRSTTTCS